MRPKRITLTPADANLTGFASNVTGGTWTLTNTATTDGLAHQVSIKNDTVTDHSLKTATIVGTDEDGAALTETINLPGPSATVETSGYFKTVTSVTPSATIGADTMDIGWVDEVSTQTVPLDWRNERIGMYVDITGTINYTVQDTGSDVTNSGSKPYTWQNTNDPDVVSATASQKSNFDNVPIATRLIVNSYSSGATLIWTLIQMDNSWH
jgi:hypothetical protein